MQGLDFDVTLGTVPLLPLELGVALRFQFRDPRNMITPEVNSYSTLNTIKY